MRGASKLCYNLPWDQISPAYNGQVSAYMSDKIYRIYFFYITSLLAYQYKWSCCLEPDKTFNKRKITIDFIWSDLKKKIRHHLLLTVLLSSVLINPPYLISVIIIDMGISALEVFPPSLFSAGCCWYTVFLMNLITLLHIFSRLRQFLRQDILYCNTCSFCHDIVWQFTWWLDYLVVWYVSDHLYMWLCNSSPWWLLLIIHFFC